MASNSFAEAARARKVSAYLLYLDAMFSRRGYDPFQDAAECVSWMRAELTKEDWAKYAKDSGQRDPSDETICAILKTYDDRAKAAADTKEDPFARFG